MPVDVDPPGLRERKKQRTRAELVAAAVRLFAERGFDRVTIEDIAAEVEVSSRTLLRYFGSKEELLLGDHDEMLRRLEVDLAARPPDEPVLIAVRNALLARSAEYEDERELLLMRSRLMSATPALRGRSLQRQVQWETVLAEAVARRLGVPGTDLRPRVVAGAALAALRAAVATWVEGGGHCDLAGLVTQALDLLDGGLQQVAVPDPPTRRPR